MEVRILGCLLEKQQTTPEYYPLTENALLAACNQKSNRDPVMELAASDVRAALERLRDEVLAWPVEGSRVARWEHNLDRSWALEAPGKALLTVLLLRGPQTVGELRGRCDRLHAFESLAEVEAVLRRLASGEEPLVAELPREPGRKESRWTHLVAGPPAQAVAGPRNDVVATASGLADRVTALEARLEELGAEVARLAASLQPKP